MKRLFLCMTLMAVSSGAAFASGLDDSPATASEPLAMSKNCDSIMTNDDGRVTIVGPKFSAADGQTLWLSSDSDQSGICLLFGYGVAVPSARIDDGNFDRTVRIDSRGHFSSFVGSSEFYRNSRIVSLMCETGAGPTVSSRLEKPPIQNDDGSFTIMGPSFGQPDGAVRWVSSTSNLDGVCRLYGFASAVEASLVSEGNFDRTVVISRKSKFLSFLSSSSDSIFNNSRIKSLICIR